MPHNCIYCENKAGLDALMVKVADLQVSTVYLFREQSHPGRCVVAYKDHIGQQFEIPEADWLRFMQDARRVAVAIDRVFHPAKVNFGSYGDTGCHAHWHIVPKYADEFEWGGVFEMNPKRCYLSEEELSERVALLQAALA